MCSALLSALLPQTMLLADRGYDADWIRELVRQQGAWANIPPKRNRKDSICFSPYLYRARNLIERFFNKIKQCRRVATRYDKLAANYLAFIKLASSEFGCVPMSPRPSFRWATSMANQNGLAMQTKIWARQLRCLSISPFRRQRRGQCDGIRAPT